MTPLLDPRSAIVSLAVELYQAHAPDWQGWCAVCRRVVLSSAAARCRGHSGGRTRSGGLGPSIQFAAAAPTMALPRLLPHRAPGSALEQEAHGPTSPVDWWGDET
jgi:hypothetical protein